MKEEVIRDDKSKEVEEKIEHIDDDMARQGRDRARCAKVETITCSRFIIYSVIETFGRLLQVNDND